MSKRGMSKKRTRPAAPRGSSRCSMSCAGQPFALGDGERREPQQLLGLAPRGEAVGHVASDDEGQLVTWGRRMQLPSGYRPCTTGRRDRPRGRTPSSRSSSAAARRHISRRSCAPGSASASLCGGTATGMSSTRVEPELEPRLLRAHQVADVRRVEGPAEDPGRACSGPDVPVALHDVLERAQLAQPDRAARVELLRRVADLGAHAELAAVGEARRGVHVDAGGVDAALEGARGVDVAR